MPCRRQASPPVEKSYQESSAQYKDRKSTRLNSSHMSISYAVFCLKKKNFAPFHIAAVEFQVLGIEPLTAEDLQRDLGFVLDADALLPLLVIEIRGDFVVHADGDPV